MSSQTPKESDYELLLQEILSSLSQKNSAVDDSDNTIWMPIDRSPASNEDVHPSSQLGITRLEAEHLACRLSKRISGAIEQHERLERQWKPPEDWHALVNELSELKNRIEHSPNFDIIRTIIPVPIGHADEVFNDSLTIGWPKTLFDFIEKKPIVDVGDASPIGTYICFVGNRLSEIVWIIDPWMDKIVEWTVSEWWIEPVVEEKSQTAVGIKLNLFGDYRKKTKSGLCGCIDSLIRWLESQPHSSNPKGRTEQSRKGSKPKPLFDTTQRDLVYQFLKLWHRYGEQGKNGKNPFRNGPVGVSELATFAKEQCHLKTEIPPSKATISRWFKDQAIFRGHKKYVVMCRNSQIESYFRIREAEAVKVFQGKLSTKERSIHDEQPDLD
ncbi:MAG: hypothetical protein Q8M16_21375 [Pirellulaceae bacterium]|nr:hypothetical protein [Pirellulaceae bacterium]